LPRALLSSGRADSFRSDRRKGRPSLGHRHASGTAVCRRLQATDIGCPIGSVRRILVLPAAARVRTNSFCSLPIPLGWVNNSNHPLSPWIDVYVSDLDRLLVTAAMPVQGLDHIEL
jgi:hypothetical protein